jgi:hypothetical protein
MPAARVTVRVVGVLGMLLTLAGCARHAQVHNVRLGPPERFGWVRQPIEFSSPPPEWRREGDNGGGWLGVRFILTGGGGQVMSVAAQRGWLERLPGEELAKLLAEVDRLQGRELLNRLARLRVQLDQPLTDAEAAAARAINTAVDRAEADALNDHTSFVRGDLEDAQRALDAFRPTLAELLPHLKLVPENQQEPQRWHLGEGRDTVLAGLPAYVSDDTLYAPEQVLSYRQVFWVANGCAFQSIFQGRPENEHVWEQVVASVRFPDDGPHATR